MHDVAFHSLPVELSFFLPEMSLKNVVEWLCVRYQLPSLRTTVLYYPRYKFMILVCRFCRRDKIEIFLMLFVPYAEKNHERTRRNLSTFELSVEENILLNNGFSLFPHSSLFTRQNMMISFFG
jgi:hypothetical protein